MWRGVLCVAVATTAFGCGSSDDGERAQQAAPETEAKSPPKPKPQGLPRAELVATLDRLCEETNKAIAPEERILAKTQPYPVIAEALEREKAKVAKNNRELYALEARPPERDALKRYHTALKRQDGYLDRVVTAARENNDAAFDALVKAKNANGQKRITAAIDLGLTKCGQP